MPPSNDLDFRPLPSDPQDLTAADALSACGGDVDRVFRNILASLASPHTTHSNSKPEDAAHAAKLA